MPSLVEIGPEVWEKNIFKFRPRIFIMSLLSSLENWYGPLLEFPLPTEDCVMLG